MRSLTICGRGAWRLALAGSVSVLALGAGQAAQAQAQPANGDATVEEVVVTGTQIRGVAPVGSPIIALGAEEISKSPTATTNDFLRQLPQVLNFGGGADLNGGSPFQGSRLNTVFANSINLRGLGTKATLTLMNNHRLAPGSVGQLFDVDAIPAASIGRIEIVADGASAIYGADAVAGVVNFILKKPANGFETTARYGWADGRDDWLFSQTAGHSWGSGGVFLVYEHSERDALLADDRPDLYNDDLSPFGGAPSSQNATPGNLIFGTAVYAIPRGQNGANLTLGQLGPLGQPNRTNGWAGAKAIPSTQRDTGLLVFEQQLLPKLKLFGDVIYTKRDYQGTTVPTAATNAGMAVPSANPFNPCAPGKNTANAQNIVCPANGSVSVAYNFIYDLGAANREGDSKLWGVTGGLQLDLPHEWQGRVMGTISEDDEYTITLNQVNTTALNQVLSGVGKPASVPFFNPFCDASANACNDPATLAHIRGYAENTSDNKFEDYTLNLNGPLFSLPGGEVKLAVGAEYTHGSLDIVNTSTASTVSVATLSTTVAPRSSRNVKSAYAELYVPLVGEGNAMPLIRSLELNLAARYDDYSDFGDTTNPKVGINYEPIEGLRFHASYGKSFRAPTLQEVNPYAAAGFLNRSQVVSAVVLEPGVVTPASLNVIFPIGGNPNLKPERAETYSVGVEIRPPQLPGLTASANYYNIKYEDKIDTAPFNAGAPGALNSGFYNDFIVLNPAYFPVRSKTTAAEFAALVAAAQATPGLPFLGPPTTAANVLAIIDSRSNNSGVIDTDGVDFSVHYRWDGDLGAVTLGVDGTTVLNYKTAPVATAPVFDRVNFFGYPMKWRVRYMARWERGGWDASAYVNWSNHYHMERSLLPAGAPVTHQHIDDYTTVDASLRYSTGDRAGLLGGITVALNGQNLFDAEPPLVLNVAGSSSSVRFDPQNASPVGRVVALQLTKKW